MLAAAAEHRYYPTLIAPLAHPSQGFGCPIFYLFSGIRQKFSDSFEAGKHAPL
jgi:hypothetical protein